MAHQARCICLLELWQLARGNDLRGDAVWMTVGKVFGQFTNQDMVGPDPFYKMQILKDDSKANKNLRNELLGSTRHRDPLLCSVNAVATMLIARFGTGGVVGQLPNFFDILCDWPGECPFLTEVDDANRGGAVLPNVAMSYATHAKLFEGMKRAAGLTHIMNEVSTKLRSWGAMHANEMAAHNDEIRRTGR